FSPLVQLRLPDYPSNPPGISFAPYAGGLDNRRIPPASANHLQLRMEFMGVAALFPSISISIARTPLLSLKIPHMGDIEAHFPARTASPAFLPENHGSRQKQFHLLARPPPFALHASLGRLRANGRRRNGLQVRAHFPH